MTVPLPPDYWDWVRAAPVELHDVRRRQWWANEEGQALHSDITQFTRSSPYQMHTRFEGKRGYVTFHRIIKERDEWDHFEGLTRLLGSYLDNQRAALNYLAVQLAHRTILKNPAVADQSLPWNDQLHPEGIEFPLFNKRAKYLSVGAGKVIKLRDEYKAEIQAVQPYHGRYKGLWDLQELGVAYRHRIIHPIAVLPHRRLFQVMLDDEPVRKVEMTVYLDDGPIKNRAQVMDFVAPGVPDDQYEDLKPKITVSIGIDDDLCRGRDCVEVINRINRDVVAVVERFERFFQ